MDFIALYHTNTLPLILGYLEIKDHLAIASCNLKLNQTKSKYLPLITRTMFYPEGCEKIEVLGSALSAALKAKYSCRYRILTALKALVPVHVILRPDLVTSIALSLSPPKRCAPYICDLSESIAQSLYERLIVRDPSVYPLCGQEIPQTPKHKRVLFVIMHEEMLPVDTHLICPTKIHAKRACIRTLAPGKYAAYSIAPDTLNGGEVTVGSLRPYLLEVFLWYLWVKHYYAEHAFHALCSINGRIFLSHDLSKIERIRAL